MFNQVKHVGRVEQVLSEVNRPAAGLNFIKFLVEIPGSTSLSIVLPGDFKHEDQKFLINRGKGGKILQIIYLKHETMLAFVSRCLQFSCFKEVLPSDPDV